MRLEAFHDPSLHRPSRVLHGDERADDLQSRIEELRVGILRQEQVESLDAEVLGAHGHDHAVRGDHVVRGEVAEVRGAVDDDDVVVVHDRFEHAAQDRLASHGDGREVHLDAAEHDVAGEQVHVVVDVADRGAGVGILVVRDVEDRRRDGLLVGKLVGLVDAAQDAQACLVVHVHEQDPESLERQCVAQVLRGGGLAGAALLVRDGDDLGLAHDGSFRFQFGSVRDPDSCYMSGRYSPCTYGFCPLF